MINEDWEPAPQGKDHFGPVMLWIAGSLLVIEAIAQIAMKVGALQ
jgi:hypothetical protein